MDLHGQAASGTPDAMTRKFALLERELPVIRPCPLPRVVFVACW
jgi:hypothetical protein